MLLSPLAVLHAEGRSAESVISMGKGIAFYRPSSESAVPLLVLLPGTNSRGAEFLEALRPAADAQGFAILAVTPRRRGNFDAIDRFFDDYEARRKAARADWPVPQFGKDRDLILAAVDTAVQDHAVDPEQIGLLGFSHGGSYALSLGLAHPERFRTVAALSPGVFVVDADKEDGPAVFLSHGRDDAVQPFRRTACAMTARLAELGRPVLFHGFDGGHEITPTGLGAALMHFLTGGERPEAGDVAGASLADCAAD